MRYYSQKNPNWSAIKLGTCAKTTIGSHGCKITCLAMLSNKTPLEVNQILLNQQGYQSGCLASPDEKMAEILGLEFYGKSINKPVFNTIAETSYYYYLGFKQHFFIILANGKIIDPLDANPYPKNNLYSQNIISYRLFKEKNMTPEICGGELQKIIFGLLGHEMPLEIANKKVAEPGFKISNYLTELLNMRDDQGRNINEKHFEKIKNGFECLEKQSQDCGAFKTKIEACELTLDKISNEVNNYKNNN